MTSLGAIELALLYTARHAAIPLFASILAGGGLIAWRRKRKAAKLTAAGAPRKLNNSDGD